MRRFHAFPSSFILFPSLVAGLMLASCNKGDGSRNAEDDTALDDDQSADDDIADDEVVDTPEDDPKDKQVKVDDKEVEVTFEGLEGRFEIAIVSVDGKTVQSSAEVENEPGDAASALSAKLELPDVDAQEELVGWNLRVKRLEKDNNEIVLLQSLLYALDPEEVTLEGPARVTENKQVAFRLKARDPITRSPLADREVELQVVGDGDAVETLKGTTDESGVAVVNLTAMQSGSYEVKAVAKSNYVSSELVDEIEVTATGSKVLLTTDKPLYKPGQTMHLRALALDSGDSRPSAGEDAVFEVEDGKGNKVFRKTFKTDDFGIASTEFVIGTVVNEGSYTVRTSVGERVSQKTVTVQQYALPKFKVEVQTDRNWYGPGDSIEGTIDAKYFFGKSVDGGQVHIEIATLDIGENVYREVMGRTNGSGVYEFSVPTPNTLVGLPLEQGLALLNLRTTVTDAAGQQVTQEQVIRVAAEALNVSVVPEATEVVTGIENRVHIFVTDPLGAPVSGASVTARAAGEDTFDLTTDDAGHTQLLWVPDKGAVALTVDVVAGDEQLNGKEFDFQAQAGGEHVLVRTDKAVYDVGDEVAVEVLTTDDSGSIFIDWLNEGQAVDLRTLDPEQGSASFKFTLDQTLTGSNRVEAYIVDEDGNLVRAGRNVFVRSANNLNVAFEADKGVYAPGESAALTFTVTDENGAPTAAALGVQIVDEAVFALVDSKPGLLESYFQLEDEFREPHYQLGAPPGSLFGLLLSNPTSDDDERATQNKAEATLAALDGTRISGLSKGSWTSVVQNAKTHLGGFMATEKARLIELYSDKLEAVGRSLLDEGCSPEEYWCEALETSFAEEFASRLSKAASPYDFWGNAYQVSGSYSPLLTLSTRGPDEVLGTTDDEQLTITATDLDFSDAPALMPAQGQGNVGGVPEALNGGYDDEASGDDLADFDGADDDASEPDPSDGDSSGAAGPRVRRDFPETLYVNPALITDGTGTATIQVDMADSITEWRISTLANSETGKLGSAVNGVTVFQDFFVDVDFPATLTRGDEIEFPIAIYNYLSEPQTVNIELEAANWYTALGETAVSVELAAGEVRGVSFPVRVDKVGRKTLTVHGLGSEKSDAVARSVLVQPDGQQVVAAQSGSIKGNVTHRVEFSPSAIEGSEQFYVNIFPAFLSQAVQGMDSLLATPNGCFEQTTSTAWPNVLVTDYMKKTDQITPEILIRAEALMSAGYQRLLTFEHPGGGFSWFGTDDPAPFLSVTAFGLLEFTDMAKVHPVDEAMIERTLLYLLSQQQGDGSWTGDMSEFFSFHTSSLRNTAFTLWAIGSAGYNGAETENAIAYLKQQMQRESADDYTLALIANAFALLSPNDSVLDDILETLIDQMKLSGDDDDLGSWDSGETQTNFYGSGSDAAVATTALVVHALLQSGGYGDAVQKGLNYLTAQKDGHGNFGSTQATIWTLKSLLLAAERGTSAAVGSLVVEVDGDTVETLSLTEETADVMRTVDLSHLAATGEHQVELTFAGEGSPSYNLVTSEHVPWADAPMTEPGPLSVQVDYDRSSLSVDETVLASVHIINETANVQNMVLVTVGLPPGFELERADFDGYVQSGALSRFEVTGKQLILYLTELAASSEQVIEYRLRATMPVKASDGGATVYPYYEPKRKTLSQAQELEVVAPAG